jgi:hypothetical protein
MTNYILMMTRFVLGLKLDLVAVLGEGRNLAEDGSGIILHHKIG